MVITAKFPSKCTRCGGQVLEGERVEWTKGGRGVTHVSCLPVALPVEAAREPLDDWWTGYELFTMDSGEAVSFSPVEAPEVKPTVQAPMVRATPSQSPAPSQRIRITVKAWIAREKGTGMTLDGTITRSTANAIQFTGSTVTSGLVSCQCCGRPLTNEMSRRLGVGPICIDTMMGGLLAELRVSSFDGMTDEQVKAVVDALESKAVTNTWIPKSQITGAEVLGEDGEPTGEEYALW